VCRVLRQVTTVAPVSMGDVILVNVLNTAPMSLPRGTCQRRSLLDRRRLCFLAAYASSAISASSLTLRATPRGRLALVVHSRALDARP